MYKSKKTPDLTRGGKSNDIAHFSFILVFTVSLMDLLCDRHICCTFLRFSTDYSRRTYFLLADFVVVGY